ncbi:hypothetical protein PR048_028510 [Dryococelus australis]|uniref:Uncharacterized protein n=1 Tax=Dryococelus australis TaxID=614101 RepID=A0ABQ9GEJ9_9NEOP|nr:hypothetical protein PR048_028510 [Dryococelus australis]
MYISSTQNEIVSTFHKMKSNLDASKKWSEANGTKINPCFIIGSAYLITAAKKTSFAKHFN